MKKKLTTLELVLFFVLISFCVPAFADMQLDCVTDEAGLLTGEQWQELNTQAAELSEAYDCGIYIITLDDFTEYVDTDEIGVAAKTIYQEYELGADEEQSGILLLLSMAERDYDLRAYGYGNTAFTDYGKDYLSEAFLDNFGEDDWFAGFQDYLTVSGEMLQSARDGHPVDTNNIPEPSYARICGVMVCTLMGFVIAFIVRGILKGQLKSVAYGTDAEVFIASEGLKLTEKYDQYTHTTQSRVYDPPEKNRSDGGGGTTVDRDGSSGKSGKF